MTLNEGREGAAATGIALMILGTMACSGADAVLKAVATGFAPAQILFLAALASMVLTLLANHDAPMRRLVTTPAPRAMLVRSVALVLASVGFYKAFVLLDFATVFLFIGIMPLLAAGLSGLMLHERVSRRSWIVLGIGLSGMMLMVPTGIVAGQAVGYFYGLLGAVAGTVSVVLSRQIAKTGTHSLAQVFMPQMVMALVMGLQLLFVGQRMTLGELALVLAYAMLVFAGRWILVVVSRLLPAWLCLQLTNLQFVWMVLIGYFVFAETTSLHVVLGAMIIALAGMILARDEILRARLARDAGLHGQRQPPGAKSGEGGPSVIAAE